MYNYYRPHLTEMTLGSIAGENHQIGTEDMSEIYLVPHRLFLK
jgi:hypothetical protein